MPRDPTRAFCAWGTSASVWIPIRGLRPRQSTIELIWMTCKRHGSAVSSFWNSFLLLLPSTDTFICWYAQLTFQLMEIRKVLSGPARRSAVSCPIIHQIIWAVTIWTRCANRTVFTTASNGIAVITSAWTSSEFRLRIMQNWLRNHRHRRLIVVSGQTGVEGCELIKLRLLADCARVVDLLTKNKRIEFPQCCPNGNYKRINCRRGMCYCVDSNGHQISLEVPRQKRANLSCFVDEFSDESECN